MFPIAKLKFVRNQQKSLAGTSRNVLKTIWFGNWKEIAKLLTTTFAYLSIFLFFYGWSLIPLHLITFLAFSPCNFFIFYLFLSPHFVSLSLFLLYFRLLFSTVAL
jgi:hypothetical protein